MREVMRPNIAALPAEVTAAELSQSLHHDQSHRRQRLYPVVDKNHRLLGVVTRSELQDLARMAPAARFRADPHYPKVAYPDEPLRYIVYRMAETGLTRLPVVERNRSHKLLGMISLEDLLIARARNLEAEHRCERVFPFNLSFIKRSRGQKAS